jgi:GAF domain-containing protein
LNKTDSPIVESVLQKKTGEWSFDSGKALHVPYVKRYLNLRKAIFAPIVVSDQVIGIYFLAREENENFSDREKAWLEQTVDYVGRAFENSNKYKHEAHKTLEG